MSSQPNGGQSSTAVCLAGAAPSCRKAKNGSPTPARRYIARGSREAFSRSPRDDASRGSGGDGIEQLHRLIPRSGQRGQRRLGLEGPPTREPEREDLAAFDDPP